MTSSKSKVYYVIALTFFAKQINSIAKKTVSAVCEIIKINADFRIFVNASYNVFLKKHLITNKIKTKFFFFKIADTLFKNAMILKCAKIKRKVLVKLFGEVGALFGT